MSKQPLGATALLVTALVLGVLLTMLTPWACPSSESGKGRVTVQQISGALDRELSIGDSKSKIVDVLDNLDIGHSFNPFDQRFEGSVRSTRTRNALGVQKRDAEQGLILVHIDVSREVAFSRAEVEEIFEE